MRKLSSLVYIDRAPYTRFCWHSFIWPLTSLMQPPLLDDHHICHIGGQGGGSRVLTGGDTALSPECPSLSPGQESLETGAGGLGAVFPPQWLPIRSRRSNKLAPYRRWKILFPPVWILTRPGRHKRETLETSRTILSPCLGRMDLYFCHKSEYRRCASPSQNHEIQDQAEAVLFSLLRLKNMIERDETG